MDLLLIGGLLLLLHRSTTQPAAVYQAAPSSPAAPAPVTHILDLPPMNSVPAVVTAAPQPAPAPKPAAAPAPAPVVMLWDGGPYPGIPGARLLLLPPGGLWNATTADGAIQRQTGGQYKVITVGSQVVAVPTTATPAPIAAAPRQAPNHLSPTGSSTTAFPNPAAQLGSTLTIGTWNSNPNQQNRYNNYIPDASIGG